MGDALRGLQHEHEAGGHLLGPALERLALGQLVEGVVDLDGREASGVVAQHQRGLELRRDRTSRAIPCRRSRSSRRESPWPPSRGGTEASILGEGAGPPQPAASSRGARLALGYDPGMSLPRARRAARALGAGLLPAAPRGGRRGRPATSTSSRRAGACGCWSPRTRTRCGSRSAARPRRASSARCSRASRACTSCASRSSRCRAGTRRSRCCCGRPATCWAASATRRSGARRSTSRSSCFRRAASS